MNTLMLASVGFGGGRQQFGDGVSPAAIAAATGYSLQVAANCPAD